MKLKFMTVVMLVAIMSGASIFANEGMPAPVEEPSAPAAAMPAGENVNQGAPAMPAMSANTGAGKEEKKRDLARRRHKRKHRRHHRRNR